MEDSRADEMTDPIVDRISEDGCGAEDDKQPERVKGFGRGERPGRKEQRVTGQERRDHQARFQEDDHKED